MRKLLFILMFLCAAQAISQTGIGTSQRQVKTPVGVSYYDSSCGWVWKDSLSRIYRVEIKDIGGNRQITSEFDAAQGLLTAPMKFIDLPTDTFVVADTFNVVKDSIFIRGNQTVLRGFSRNHAYMMLSGRKNVTIEGISFIGTNDSAKTYEGGILATNSQNVLIQDCSFKNLTKHGVQFSDSVKFSAVRGSTFENIFANGVISPGATFRQGVGIFLFKNIKYCDFSNNIFKGNMSRGIGLDDATGGTDTSNSFPSSYNVVSDNVFYGIKGVATSQGIAVLIEGSNFNTVSGNAIDSCATGIGIANPQSSRKARGNKIVGNLITRSNASGNRAMVISNAAENMITDNMFYDNTRGIDITYQVVGADTMKPDSNLIAGNQFIRNTTAVIMTRSLNDRFYNNYFTFNTTNISNTTGSTPRLFMNLFSQSTRDSAYFNQPIKGTRLYLSGPNASSEVVSGDSKAIWIQDTTTASRNSPDIAWVATDGERVMARKTSTGWQLVNHQGGAIALFADSGSVSYLTNTKLGINNQVPDSSLDVIGGARITNALRLGRYVDFDSATASVASRSGRLYSLGASGLFYYRGSTLVRIDSLIGGGGGGDTIWARSGGFVYPVNTSDPVVIGGATGDSLFTVLGSSNLGGNTLVGGNITISGNLTTVEGLFTGETTIADTAHFNSGTVTAGVATFLDSIYGAGSAKFRQIFTDSVLVQGGIATLAAAGDSVRITISGMTPDGVAFANWADSTVNPFGVPNITCHSGYIKIVSSFNEISDIRVVYAYIRKQ